MENGTPYFQVQKVGQLQRGGPLGCSLADPWVKS